MGEQVKPERGSNGRFTPREAVEQVTEHTQEIQAERAPAPSNGTHLLNQAYEAMSDFVVAGEAEKVVAVLYAAATHAVECFPSFGRLLFTADTFEAGKTTFMMTTALMSHNPEDVSGSRPSLNSLLAEYHNQNKKKCTLYFDEISSIFGKSGLVGSKDPIADVLRKGYERDATSSWSVNRVNEKFSIYTPFLMAGNGTAVPTDIRSRCIVLKTSQGVPNEDLLSDLSKPRLRGIGAALAAEIAHHKDRMMGVSYEKIIPAMTARRHMCYRPLLAIAQYVGGEEWFKRAMRAFMDLTNTGIVSEVLSPDQETLRDMNDAVKGMPEENFVDGKYIREILFKQPRFNGCTPISISKEMKRAMPVDLIQKHVPGGNPVRGWHVRDIRLAWDDARPAFTPEMAYAAEADPLDAE